MSIGKARKGQYSKSKESEIKVLIRIKRKGSQEQKWKMIKDFKKSINQTNHCLTMMKETKIIQKIRINEAL